MARTRTVFGTHANLAHTWAQQSFTIGHSADRRMYFEGDTIYSYGRHYPMARFTDITYRGERVVLFKQDGYSISTSKHRHHTRSALDGLNVLVVYVDDVSAGYAMNVRGLKRDFTNAAELLASPTRNRHVDLASRLVELQNRADTVRDFAAIYGEALGEWEGEVTALADKITAAMNAFNDPAKLAKRAKDKVKRDTAKAVTRVNEALQKIASNDIEPSSTRTTLGMLTDDMGLWMASGRPHETLLPLIKFAQLCLLIREQEALERVKDPNAGNVLTDRRWRSYGNRKPVTPEEWMEGAGLSYDLSYRHSETLVRRKGDRLETSRGAEVPFKHAVIAYLKACECRRTGTTWKRNGEKVAVGVYQLDAIDADGNIVAGCHTIAFDEMQRLALREVPHLVRASFPVPALIAA